MEPNTSISKEKNRNRFTRSASSLSKFQQIQVQAQQIKAKWIIKMIITKQNEPWYFSTRIINIRDTIHDSIQDTLNDLQYDFNFQNSDILTVYMTCKKGFIIGVRS